jgi:hypothetical protein
VINLTERKGSCGASVLEHATKLANTTASEHKRKTRPEASEIKKGMDNPEKIMTNWLVIYSNRAHLSSDNRH